MKEGRTDRRNIQGRKEGRNIHGRKEGTVRE
jgi:hypothetical protein